jgi:hypothetical protein
MAEVIKKQKIYPPLPLKDWEATKETIHLFFQIAGKIRLALAPRKNHWWHLTLYVNSRGIGTSPIPYENGIFEINFDFVDHNLVISTCEGHIVSFKLEDGLSVARFYSQLSSALKSLDINVEILAKPYKNKSTEPFATDNLHATYDSEFVNKFWHVLYGIDSIFKEFSGRFNGKVSPVHLFWHSFDLVVARFSGRPAPEMKNGNASDRDAYSHEIISAGFWPGDDTISEPAFYCYTYPSPEGITEEPLMPAEARWELPYGSPMAIYRYEDFRQADNPRLALLDFLETTYLAGAKKAGWDIDSFKVRALYP